jgi:hypothetical protein
MIGRRGYWLLLTMLLLITLGTASHKDRLDRILAGFFRFPSDDAAMLTLLVAPPLLFLLLVLLVRWEHNAGTMARSSQELDRLLQRKREGLLRRAALRIRGTTAPRRRNAAASADASQGPQAQCSWPTEGLDRLVQKKHSGAWSPSVSKAEADLPAEQG